jgi:hypothetical protein
MSPAGNEAERRPCAATGRMAAYGAGAHIFEVGGRVSGRDPKWEG